MFPTFALATIVLAAVAGAQSAPIDIGSRVEPFVDGQLIDRLAGADLTLQHPIRREVVLVTDMSWEGPSSGYFTAIQDGATVRIYYRGYCPVDDSKKQVTCMVESSDGIHFTRPKLGLFAFGGSRDNNIVWRGVESHNFAPLLDRNPACPPDERYKALGGIAPALWAFASPDGIHWKRKGDHPALTHGTFDSLNTAFWDDRAKLYRCYSRYFDGEVRAIQSSTSKDFLNWTEPVPNRYAAGIPHDQFYTNGTRPCLGAEHILLSFPSRFVPERTKLPNYHDPGVSDSVFMTSRDGLNWDRMFLDGWLRTGPDDRNWSQRSNMPACGIVSVDPNEFSMYATEHYQWPDNRLRRISIRKFGWASVHAPRRGGEMVTRPIVFSGRSLCINYATSAAGSIRVEIQDADGSPIPGYRLEEMDTLFGDELNRPVTWKGSTDVSKLSGRTVRLRFVLQDADLFSLQTVQGDVQRR